MQFFTPGNSHDQAGYNQGMSVITSADEALELADKAIEEALRNLGALLYRQLPGREKYSLDTLRRINEAGDKLGEAQRLLYKSRP